MKSITFTVITTTICALLSPVLAGKTAEQILLAIVPTANTCTGAPYAAECATASQAVQPLLAGFSKYNINTPQEQAALLSWMAYESAEFKYVKNHYPAPGRPGQGCRNMMMPNFVAEYASTLSEVTSAIDVKTATPAAILDAVLACEHDWAAAAWFYSTKCDAATKAAVVNNGQAGWAQFITGCVQTSMDDGRVKYWTAAKTALGM